MEVTAAEMIEARDVSDWLKDCLERGDVAAFWAALAKASHQQLRALVLVSTYDYLDSQAESTSTT